MLKNAVKYTYEVLSKAAAESVSVAGVLRLLGMKQSGGTHAHVVRRMRALGVDTSHFLGACSNHGAGHRGGPDKLTASAILVHRPQGEYRQKTPKLVRALLEAGVPHICAACFIGPVWNGARLALQVDHKNGDWLDDRKENLAFLCPNCHSQTAGWCRKKRARGGTRQTPHV